MLIADNIEISEPSSLPLSERLRFFSRISAGWSSARSSTSSRNFVQGTLERSSSTPQSSNNSMSSPSVTPTPLDSSPVSLYESCVEELDSTTSTPASTALGSPLEASQTQPLDVVVKPSVLLRLARCASQQAVSSTTSELLEQSVVLTASGTPPALLTPTMKRIKLKTVGKLMLPQTFLCNDRNNNNCKNINQNTLQEPLEATSATEEGELLKATGRRPPLKKIGKIKSPFIEMLQQQQSQTQTTTSTTPTTAAAATTTKPKLTNGVTMREHVERYVGDVGASDESSPTGSVELRQKIGLRNCMSAVALSTCNSSSQQRSSCNIGDHYTTPPTTSATTTPTMTPRNSGIVDKYGKFFGLAAREAISSMSPTQFAAAAYNRHVRQPTPIQEPRTLSSEAIGTPLKRRDLMKRVHNGSTMRSPLRENRYAAESRAKRARGYDEINVSPAELRQAENNFSRLVDELRVTEQDLRAADAAFPNI